MSHALINELVANRLRREELQAELTRLYRDRAELITAAAEAGCPTAEIERAAGRAFTELDAAQVRAAEQSTRH